MSFRAQRMGASAMDRTTSFADSLRDLIKDCGTTEDGLRKLREYERHIQGVWHYPDDLDPCHDCMKSGLTKHRLPQVGRGYVGTGPFTIVSDTPSGDVHFEKRQAKLYYSKLKAHGLESAHLMDVFNTASSTRDSDEQKALFLVQIELVKPKAMLVMDMASRPRKRSTGWHYCGPLQTVQMYFQTEGFTFAIDPDFHLRAATVTCGAQKGAGFSFDVYTIYHYTKLTEHRGSRTWESDWEKRFTDVLSMASLRLKAAEPKAELARRWHEESQRMS